MAVVTVRLTPRGGADRVEGWEPGPGGRPLLKARVRAAPTDGQANAALVMLMARRLSVPKSSVMILRGASARVKFIEIADLSQAEIEDRLTAGA